MHILIGFITALATLLFALERLGIDLGWLNPWAWRRRRAWQKQVTANPVFSLEKPMDAIALLATAAAKIDGDLSLEEKEALNVAFQNTFSLSKQDASHLLGLSVHLLGSGEEVYRSPNKVLQKSLVSFTSEQKKLSLEMLGDIISLRQQPSDLQLKFVESVKKILLHSSEKKSW